MNRISKKVPLHTKIANRTKFEDMNLDCQLLILRLLSISDLFSIGKTSKLLASVAKQEIGRRFATKPVAISQFGVNSVIREQEGLYLIEDIPTAVNLLNEYSHSIRKLEIRHIPTEQTEGQSINVIYDLIKERYSETLVQLHLVYLDRSFFENMTTVFTKVENFVWRFEAKTDVDLGNDHQTLADLFPNLKRLQLSCIKVRNSSKILVNYPYLEHLDVNLGDSRPFTQPSIVELFRKNPQVLSLSIRMASNIFLKTIADELPNLETLELRAYRYEGHSTDRIHFKRLKCLKVINCYAQTMPKDINFGVHLEEVEVEPYLDLQASFINILENNPNVTKFRVTDAITDQNVLQLAAKLSSSGSNLVELLIVCNGLKEESLVELIQCARNLHSIRLINLLTLFSAESVFRFRQRFDDEWVIKVIGINIYLEKKDYSIE